MCPLFLLISKKFTEKRKCESKSMMYVYFCSFVADLLLVTVSFSAVWSSPVVLKLQSNDTDINPLSAPITTIQESLLVGIPSLSGFIGYLVAPKISDRIGRKKTLLTLAICSICSFSTIAFAGDIYVYFVCAMVNGIYLSSVLATVSVYNNEISEASIRGRVFTMMAFSHPLGSLLGYSFGSITSVEVFSLIATVPSLLFVLLSVYIPESPIYFYLKGREEECLKCLADLGVKNLEVEYEKLVKRSAATRSYSIVDIFRARTNRKSLGLSVMLLTLQNLSGCFVFLTFIGPIFNESGVSISGDAVGILVGSIQLVLFLITITFIDKINRRTLLTVSSISCVVCLVFLGLYFYSRFVGSDFFSNMSWFPILCIVLYYVGYVSGLGPLPTGIIGELFSNEMRSVGIGLVLAIDNISIFAQLFSFPLISEYFGIHFCLWIYSFGLLIFTIVMVFTLPETRGKTFTEIQNALAGEQEVDSENLGD